MDQVDVDRAVTTEVAGTSKPVVDAEQGLWTEFGSAATPQAYYKSWLALQCREIGGVVQAVVLLGPADTGPYAPAAVWPDSRRNPRQLSEIAERALTERRGLVIPRAARREGDAATRARVEVGYPIEVGGKLYGVVALEVAPRHQADLQSILRKLQWGAAWLEIMLLREDLTRTSAIRDRFQTVLDLVATGFAEERFYAAATAFTTAVATRLGCDRVAIGFLRRGRSRVRAISHTAQFREQTNLVRAIAAAMDEAIDQQATVVHPQLPERPPQVTRMQGELARQHGSGSICSIPMSSGGRIVGAMTFERHTDQPFDIGTVELAEALAAMAGPVLELHRREDRWLVVKAGDSIRMVAGAVIGPRHIGAKLGAVAAIAVIAFLAFAKGEFRISGTTTLEPIVRQAAAAPFNGYVAEAPARAGDLVKRGQLLARLDDRELRLERMKRLAQYEQFSRQQQQALAAHNAAQVMILTAQMDQSRAEIALFDQQLAHTRVEAPMDGIVVTGDLSQSLAAPVERGQVLFEVSPVDAFRLVVQVDERDVAEVKPGQHGTLVLTGTPTDVIPFRVDKVTPVSTSKESRNYFRIEASVTEKFSRLRPGMEGVGKVAIDRRHLAWIWTRQALDWVRLQLWTWLP